MGKKYYWFLICCGSMKKYNNYKDILKVIKDTGSFFNIGTRKEVRYLPNLLRDNEEIYYITSGRLQGNTWLITCTNKRLLFLDRGFFFGTRTKEFRLEKINGVSYSENLIWGVINIEHGGNGFTIGGIKKRTVKKMAESIQKAIEEYFDESFEETIDNLPKDNFSLIKSYKELLDLNIITEEEFLKKKSELLDL